MEKLVAAADRYHSGWRRKGAKYQVRIFLRSEENGIGTLRSIEIDGITRVIGQNNACK